MLTPVRVCMALLVASAQGAENQVTIAWTSPPVANTTAVPTYLDQVNPSMDRTSPVHNNVFQKMCTLAAPMVRYLHWSQSQAPFPEQIEAHFNFSLTDQYISDFMLCPRAEQAVINFDAGPAWLHTGNNLSLPLRDPSGIEYGEWISRIVSWYTKGGFVDRRTGKHHQSQYQYRWTHYEVLNEPNLAHYMSRFHDGSGGYLPDYVAYTRLYDGITSVLRRDHPELKLHALSLAQAVPSIPSVYVDDWFTHFFDTRSHTKHATPPEYVTYHFYALAGEPVGHEQGDWPSAGPELPVEQWPVHIFKQAARFTARAAHVNSLIRAGSFGGQTVRISVNEVGMQGDSHCPNSTLFNTSKIYWNLRASLWGYYYGSLAGLGVVSIASSQIIGYPAAAWSIHGSNVKLNYPCVSMLDWHTGQNTAVSWAVLMFARVLGDGPKAVFKANVSKAPATGYWPMESVVYSIGFKLLDNGKKVILLSNTNSSSVAIRVDGARNAVGYSVDQSAGHGEVPYSSTVLQSDLIMMDPLAVMLVQLSSSNATETKS